MDDFKTRLKFYMRKRGFNPTSLARKAHLSATAVRDILEHEGTPNPRIDTFAKLCYALNVSPYHLSPDFEKTYTPRQRLLLDKLDKLDGR
jgi:transcriptional regulator with XRE-family HTH domain